jgi:hypothetical protein
MLFFGFLLIGAGLGIVATGISIVVSWFIKD